MRTLTRLAIPVLLAACSNAPPAAPPPAGSSPAPTPKAAAPAKKSYSLKLPERWTRADGAGFETIRGPEGRVSVHIVETTGDDLSAAITGGWKLASPGMQLTERTRASGAPNERFSEELVVTYTDDANEQMAQGVALRHAHDRARVYVLLIEGPMKTVQKRGAELHRILSSIEVEGAAKLAVSASDVKPFDEARRKAFFAFVDEARNVAGVPGVTVAVVTPEGRYTAGFGTRVAGTDAPVGPATQFMIGSITKSFSTLLLATLVDRGQLSWDTKVEAVYPSFELGDARAAELEIQHLFCACVGAPRQDMELLFEFAHKKPGDVFGEVATMKLTTGFGETFQYNNQLTAAGGYIAGHVATSDKDVGRAYAAALTSRVLAPLAMTSTSLDEQAVQKRGDYAMPHHLDWAGVTETLPLALERFVKPYAPAGALWSTADDMAKYLEMQIARGKTPGGERVVSEKNLERTQTAQIEVSDQTGYGMGWLVGKYRGLVAVEHSGGTMGFNSDLVFFPEIGVGMFIAGNRSPSLLNGAVRARLLEILFDLPEKTGAKLAHDVKEVKRVLGESASKVSKAPVPRDLVGSYTSDRLGSMSIRAAADGAVILDVGEWQTTLAVVDPKERANALMITSGVLQGAILLRQDVDGAPALVLKHSQTDYIFRKKK